MNHPTFVLFGTRAAAALVLGMGLSTGSTGILLLSAVMAFGAPLAVIAATQRRIGQASAPDSLGSLTPGLACQA